MRNDFKSDEIVSMKGKEYPVVGGRLRLAHEDGIDGITTQIIQFEPNDFAVVSARITLSTENSSRPFTGHGVASARKDARLIDSLLELAETRAIARALRFAGYGVEYTGAEELGENAVPLRGSSRSQRPAQVYATVEEITETLTEMRLDADVFFQFLALHNIEPNQFPKERLAKMKSNPEASKDAIYEALGTQP